MGTRRGGAERRQVSPAVEALEDRFLLSGAVSFPTPAATNEHSALFAAAHNGGARNENRSPSPQAALDQSFAWPTQAAAAKNNPRSNYALFLLNAPVKPMMGPQQDGDGHDDDSLGKTDGDAPRNVPLVLALSEYTCTDAMPSLDCPAPSPSSTQLIGPAANLFSFLPLLSASGLGVTRITPLAPATVIPENPSSNPDPAPSKEEMRPMPAVPPALPSPAPQAAQPADPPPSSVGEPLVELLPIDVEALKQGVDAFFEQLGDLSEEWREGRVLEELTPWLLAASMAGYGWIRLRDRRDRHLADLLGTDRPEAASPLFLPGGDA